MIFEYFFPDLRYKSVMDIDVEALKKRGITLAILDIDNTLVPYTSPLPDENALAFLERLKKNSISFCFVSNNSKERIDIFNEKIGAKSYPRAKKPLLSGIGSAMRDFGAEKNTTVLIGDQIFTDIWGGKRAGILTVLVEPIKEVESSFFKFKRYFEKKVIKSYERRERESV